MKDFTETELSHEQWRDIEGYDGLYEVSDLGRVRSRYSGEWRVLSAVKDKDGYLRVNLWKDGKHKNISVHRLVAQAFIPNDDESKTQINHKNEDKSDNKVSNIEWCDRRYNNTYNDIHRRRNTKRRKIKSLYRPDLTIKQNIELFKSDNGIECCRNTVSLLRKDLGLINNKTKRDEIRPLYNPDLSIKQNLELFKSKGIECSIATLYRIRQELGLINNKTKRDKIKSLYNPELSIDDNLEIFRVNGIECSRVTVKRLRKDLGLSKKYTKRL